MSAPTGRPGGRLFPFPRRRGRKPDRKGGRRSGRGRIPDRVDISGRPETAEAKERTSGRETDTIAADSDKEFAGRVLVTKALGCTTPAEAFRKARPP